MTRTTGIADAIRWTADNRGRWTVPGCGRTWRRGMSGGGFGSVCESIGRGVEWRQVGEGYIAETWVEGAS